MNKLTYLALCTMLLSGTAQANGGKHPSKPPLVKNTVTVAPRLSQTAKANADADASAAAYASGGSASAEGGDASASQSQTASANNAGNSQSVEFTSPKNIGVRSVPTAIAPNIYTTASCAMSASAGASALGWGVSAGGTKVYHECVMLETARFFSQLGYPTQGLEVLCATPTSIEVFGSRDACLAAGALSVAPIPAPVIVPPAGDYVTREELDRAFKASVAK